MRRKPKYLDRDRREARKRREFWDGAQWSPTQRKDILERSGIDWGTIMAIRVEQRHDKIRGYDLFNGFNRIDGQLFTGGPTIVG